MQCPKCDETITTASLFVDPTCKLAEKGQSKLTKFYSTTGTKIETAKNKEGQITNEREKIAYQRSISAYLHRTKKHVKTK